MEKFKKWADDNLQGDRVIWAVVVALSAISILVVYSSIGTLAYRKEGGTESYLLRHTFMIFLGLATMWAAHKLHYKYYSGLSRIGLWLSVPLLLYTYKFGTSINDASRWLQIPIINQNFQPSDFASLMLIINLAGMLSRKQDEIDSLQDTLLPMLAWSGLICALIGLSNISTAVLLFLTCILLMFIGRVPVKYLMMLMLVGALAGTTVFYFGQRGTTAVNRVKEFIAVINGEAEPGFQAKHGLIAIASGGLTGKGPGNSDQRNILPYPYSDFIYAIVIEEYGLVGGVVVLMLFLLFLHRGMKAAYNSERAFGGLLSAGLSFDLVCQALVNMGVVVNLGPITGQPLPFMSWGGTAMVFNGLAAGIILSVSRGERDEVSSDPKPSEANVTPTAESKNLRNRAA
ncbi:MAG: FtsW/RodA/SpoVE family cell cycle protein [Cyclobacteriaceae bacterium]